MQKLNELSQLEAAIESLTEGLVISDPRGNILSMNRAALALHQYESLEQARKHLNAFPETFELRALSGEVLPAEQWPLARALSGERFSNHEVQVRRLDTGTTWIGSYSGSPVFDSEGTFMLAVLTVQDVTAQHKVKEALRESEAYLPALAEHALVAIFTIDANDVIMYANPAAHRIFGYEAEELLGRPFSMLIPQAMRERHRAGMERYLATGKRHISWEGVELTGLTKDGRLVPLEVTLGHVMRGGEHFFTGIARDITARKQAEQEQTALLAREQAARAAAEASEERMAFLAEASAVLASPLDYEGTVRRVADLAVARLADWCVVSMPASDGTTIEQVAVAHRDPEKVAWARELRRRYPPDPAAPIGSPQVIRTGQAEFYPEITEDQLAAAARDADHLGLLRQVGFRSAMIVPMQARGETLGAITFVYSDSDRRYTPADLRLAEELARRAAQEVANAQLYRTAEEARQQAEEMSRLKSAFLANMSHEIRTPLTGMIGFASLLADRVGEKEQRYAQRIEAGGQRLMDTLNAVLVLAQLEANQATLQLEPLCVAEEIRQVLELLERQIKRKGLVLQFHTEPAAKPARAHLDRGALSSIMHNLVGNAIKFTDRGSIMVTVEQHAKYVCVQVEDTGIGIDEAFLSHLFEPFRQESRGWNRSHEGAGLGLSITKRLAEKMNGEIEARSKKGHGTRFTVRFPLASVEDAAGDEQAEPGPAPSLPPDQVRLLVVEDNLDTQLFMRILLEEMGEVRVASTAEEALEEAKGAHGAPSYGTAEAVQRSRPFDAVLMDINLGPGMSGTDVLRELRTLPEYRDVPVAAVTAYALPGDRERLLAMGFNAYLAKPFSVGELAELTTRLLERS